MEIYAVYEYEKDFFNDKDSQTDYSECLTLEEAQEDVKYWESKWMQRVLGENPRIIYPGYRSKNRAEFKDNKTGIVYGIKIVKENMPPQYLAE